MSDKPSITPAQQDALEKAYAVLGEHFDTILISVLWEPDLDEPGEAIRHFFKGGRIAALGLAVSAQKHLLEDGEPDQP